MTENRKRSAVPVTDDPENSTFASRRAARLEREARDGVPERRPATLRAGDDAESITDVTITRIGAEDTVRRIPTS